MNATFLRNLTLSALGCALAAGTSAWAGPIGVTVDFSCADGQGVKTASGNVCTGGTGPNSATAINSWSQGFAGGAVNIGVSGTSSTNPSKPGTPKSVYYNPQQGDPKSGLATQNAGTYTLTVTDTGGYLFSFVGINVGEAVPAGRRQEIMYTIQGYNGATLEFTETGGICLTVGSCPPAISYTWISSTSPDLLTELVISTNDPYGAAYYDNLEVNEYNQASPIPEPGSLFLLGTGLLGLAFVASRKSRIGSLSPLS